MEASTASTKKVPAKKNYRKNAGTFTHFINIPLTQVEVKSKIQAIQNKIYSRMSEDQKKVATLNNPDGFHITIAMLNLPREEQRQNAVKSLEELKGKIESILITGVKVCLDGIRCFRIPHKVHPGYDEFDEVSVIYMDLTNNEFLTRIEEVSHVIIKDFIRREIIHEDDLKAMNIKFKEGKYKPEKMHITLFRVHEQSYKDDSGTYVKRNWRSVLEDLVDEKIGEIIVPFIDISTRFTFDPTDKFYIPLSRIHISSTVKEIKEEIQGEEKEVEHRLEKEMGELEIKNTL